MADIVPTPITIARCTGGDLPKLIPDIAALRVSVFRAFPYLYDGDRAYEEDYLTTYLASPDAAVIVARQNDVVVGVSTCLPLAHETDNVQAPFRARSFPVEDFFYFGESVLLPGLRGQGVGVAFFREREAHARAVSNSAYACFCAVMRKLDHPARPPGYAKLDGFWRNRGFSPRPDLTCEMRWRDVGDAGATSKTLTFWMKSLHDAALA